MTASVTLLQIRQFVAQEMGGMGQGGFLSSTATSGSSTTLVDTAWPVKTTLVVDEQWKDAWLLRPAAAAAADRVRLVDTYTASTGTFTVDNAYTNAPAAAEAYEIHTTIEPATAMLTIINEGLKRCMLEVDFALSPVALAQRHSVATAAPWLNRKSWVRSVGYLGAADSNTTINPYTRLVRGEAVEDSGTVYLQHDGRSFLSTDTLYVKAMKPAYNACTAASVSFGTASVVARSGTLWTITVASTTGMVAGQLVTLAGFVPLDYNGIYVVNTVPSGTTFTILTALIPAVVTTFGTVNAATLQNGLALDTDKVPVDFEWAGWAAIVEGWRRYAQIVETGAKSRMVPTRAEAAVMFSEKTKDNCRWPLLAFRPLLWGGPRQYALRAAYKASTS